MRAKQSQRKSRYCNTKNENNDKNNKYNRSGCGGSSWKLRQRNLDRIETNWELTSLVCIVFFAYMMWEPFLCLFKFMLNYARTENEIWKKLFPWVASCGLCWEKMYKLKRSIWMEMIASVSPAHLIFLTCTCVYIAFNSYVRTTTHTRAIIRICLSLLASRTPSAGLLKLWNS